MSNYVSIQTALRLPAPDIEALIQGRMIATMPRIFINPQRQFALYPSDTSINALPAQQYYRSNFLPTVQKALTELSSEAVVIKAWARCELCQVLDEAESFDVLSQLTVWTEEALHKTLSQRGHIFLTYLRVYRLPQPFEMPVNPNPRFIPLPAPLTVSEATPVLSNSFFEKRCQQMKDRQPSLHPELEELESAIALLSATNPAAEELDQDIKIFLGWASSQTAKRMDSDLAWIQKIAEVGNSSDGNQFEKLVRKSLLKLGFTNSNQNSQASLDPDATGGAGGLDFYCEAPYPVVGECKATKSEKVPDGTPAQLIKLGYKHLQEQYDSCIKLIVAAGDLTVAALKTAEGNKISVIRPETLQSLVELQAQYKGSIDLMKLKERLQDAYGLADEKVEQYLAEVRNDIKVRSQLVQAVKQLGELGSEHLTAEIRVYYNAVLVKEPKSKLNELLQVHDLLVELSSPLTGHLGRIKGIDWKSDRFYFLRELSIT
jgi:hypothetical protein